MSRTFMRGEMKPIRLDDERMSILIHRLRLRLCADSNYVWKGKCPFCGGIDTLIIFQKYRTVRCGNCGLEGGFGAAPERKKIISKG